MTYKIIIINCTAEIKPKYQTSFRRILRQSDVLLLLRHKFATITDGLTDQVKKRYMPRTKSIFVFNRYLHSILLVETYGMTQRLNIVLHYTETSSRYKCCQL